MRIKILRQPSTASIDGIRLDRFQPGREYEVGTLVGAVFLAEGWAEPAETPGKVDATINPPNLIRDIFPPYYNAPLALVGDRRRRGR